VRLFLAVNLSEAARASVWRETAPLRAAAPSVAWVRKALYHFTIKFLGQCTVAQAEQIRISVSEITSRHAPITFELHGAGAFPNFRRPRIVWIGTARVDAMKRISTDVDDAMTQLGFPRETRPFAAHLTIGRVKRELDRAEGVALEREAHAVTLAVAVSTSSVDLMSSELSRSGPAYVVVSRCILRADVPAADSRDRSAH
jgi:RNA 2',3'-cyclic 3'-phosphodiesterase